MKFRLVFGTSSLFLFLYLAISTQAAVGQLLGGPQAITDKGVVREVLEKYRDDIEDAIEGDNRIVFGSWANVTHQSIAGVVYQFKSLGIIETACKRVDEHWSETDACFQKRRLQAVCQLTIVDRNVGAIQNRKIQVKKSCDYISGGGGAGICWFCMNKRKPRS